MANRPADNYYQQDEVSLKKILIFLYRGKWFFLVVLALVAIITHFYLKTIAPSYEASITYRVPSERSVSVINNLRYVEMRSDKLSTGPKSLFNKSSLFTSGFS